MTHFPRILILGGNRYNLRGIQALREAGFYVFVADRNPQAPGLAAADVALPLDLYDYEGILAAVRQHGGVDGVVSLNEAGVRPADYLARALGLPSIGQTAAERATSKAAMRQAWADSPFSVDFRIAYTLAEATQAAQELGGFPLLMKPDRSFGGSRGVSRVDTPHDLPAAFAFAQQWGLPNSAVVVEQFIPSVHEYSSEVLLHEGQIAILAIGEKLRSPSYPYRVDIRIQYPSVFAPEQMAQIEQMYAFATRALGLTYGVAHIEFGMTAELPKLFELGARTGGGHIPQIVKHVSGVDELAEVCRMACGLPPTQRHPSRWRGGVYHFLVFPQGRVQQFVIPDEVRCHPNVWDVDITFSNGSLLGPLDTAASRAGFIVTLGDTRADAVAVADWACQRIYACYDDGQIHHALPSGE